MPFIGVSLYTGKVRYARNVVQFAVGLYMLIYLGILSRENMQIEGFWYYLFLGVFEAAVIHYVIAKILGPLLFGRGWCGYACWTAMILDLLPHNIPARPRKKNRFYPLHHLRRLPPVCRCALCSACPRHRADHVPELYDRQCPLLCSRHRSRLCTARQQGVLQIHLPCYRLFKAR